MKKVRGREDRKSITDRPQGLKVLVRRFGGRVFSGQALQFVFKGNSELLYCCSFQSRGASDWGSTDQVHLACRQKQEKGKSIRPREAPAGMNSPKEQNIISDGKGERRGEKALVTSSRGGIEKRVQSARGGEGRKPKVQIFRELRLLFGSWRENVFSIKHAEKGGGRGKKRSQAISPPQGKN